MLFETDDLEELTNNIKFYHLLYISENIGAEMLSRADRLLLRERGVDYIKHKEKPDLIKYAYNFGKLESNDNNKSRLEKLTFSQYKQFIKENPEKIPVRKDDYWTLKSIKQQAYNDIKKLSAKIEAEFVTHLIETSKTQRLKIERVLNKQTKGKAVTDEIINSINSFLAQKTKQWAKQFELISAYAMHSAYQHGVASELLHDDINVKVYFLVHEDACQNCKRTYLHKDGRPRIFLLKHVITNGSNIGRKVDDLVASVDPLHPNCRCRMTIYNKGYVWSEKSGKYIKSKKS